nr:MAG TPA: hypothetical protein [Caudoviricetes sp.]
MQDANHCRPTIFYLYESICLIVGASNERSYITYSCFQI